MTVSFTIIGAYSEDHKAVSIYLGFISAAILYTLRKEINLKNISEGIASFGGVILFIAAKVLLTPWAGWKRERNPEESYSLFAIGIAIALLGLGIRQIALKRKLNKSVDTTPASAPR